MKSTNFSHAELILELPAVLELVAAGCINEGARSKIRSLHPHVDPGKIEVSLREIEEMRALIEEQGDISLPETECRNSIEDALNKNVVIQGKELIKIAGLERGVLALVKLFSKGQARFPSLFNIVQSMVSNVDLVEAIERAIGADGEILDQASDELSAVRRKISSSREALRRISEGLAKRYGEKAYPTILEGRFRLLIPRDRFKRSDGIVHSLSHSGESVYIEPFQLVEKNNALESLLHEERAEESRILKSITERIRAIGLELLENIDSVEELDATRAKALFSSRFNCVSPVVSSGRGLRLVRARHPLLEVSFGQARSDGEQGGSSGDKRVVPLDLELKADERVLVITGPNAGGKTVALKTLGIIVLMFQCGLQVPCAQGTELRIFKRVFVDIGDEQSLSASLSTFTSHLRHLDSMCRLADQDSLCLIDEIGDGTDPDEGSALANATLERLLSRGTLAVATTHYGKVKTHAMMVEGISNASMLFDDKTQRPLYVLLQGIAGRSRGIETASRCGFDPVVIERAKSFLGEKAYRLETLLSELEASRLALERERETLRIQSEELGKVIKTYTEREENLRRLEATHDERARIEARELLLNARREIEKIVKSIRESGAGREEIKEGRERLRRMLQEIQEKPAHKEISASKDFDALKPNDRVALNASGHPGGTVLEVQNNVATVEINGKKIKIDIRRLYKISSERPEPASKGYIDVEFEPLGSNSLDVRGKEREEALQAVDRFIDQAVLNGLHELIIIHGVGEGILLEAVRNMLQDDPRVESYRLGNAIEGGAGVSIVRLR